MILSSEFLLKVGNKRNKIPIIGKSSDKILKKTKII